MNRLTTFMLGMAAAALALALPAQAFADHLAGSNDWQVTYTADGAMDDNYSARQYADEVGSLQPGDDITFHVALKHENAQAADWYMSNEVLKSLEEGAATGSAYGYELTYTDPSGATRTLYDSASVGGDDSTGLLAATSALDDFFYLDNLTSGQSASVSLVVSLDGETEGNAYFDTLARLQMNFAVDPSQVTSTTGGGSPSPSSSSASSLSSASPSASSSSSASTPEAGTSTQTRANDANRTAVRTGDDTNLLPFFIAMVVSGVLLLLLGIYSVRSRRKVSRH